MEPAFQRADSGHDRAAEIETLAGGFGDPRRRAENLLALARTLAAAGDHELALTAVDAAMLVDDEPALVALAQALATSIAAELAEPRRRVRWLLRLRAGVNWALWQRTKKARFYAKWRECSDALAEADSATR